MQSQTNKIKLKEKLNHSFELKSGKLGFKTCQVSKEKKVKARKDLYDGYNKAFSESFAYFELNACEINFDKEEEKVFEIEFSYQSNDYLITFDFIARNIFKISVDYSREVVEIYLNHDFNFSIIIENQNDISVSESPSPFFDLNKNQILRYWLNRPIFQLGFNNELQKFIDYCISSNKALQKELWSENKTFEESEMISLDNNRQFSLFEKYEQRILNSIAILPLDLQFSLFVILSSNILENPIDIEDEFLLFLQQEYLDSIDISNVHFNHPNKNNNQSKNNYKSKEYYDSAFINLYAEPEKNLNYSNMNNYYNNNTSGNKLKIVKFFQNYNFQKFSSTKHIYYQGNKIIFDTIEQEFKKLKNKENHYLNFSYNHSFNKFKKLIITPNRLVFSFERLLQNNRVLDTYKEYSENFMTVSITNNMMHQDFYVFSEKFLLVDHLEKILNKGIFIGNDIKFQFFTYSNSQLRAKSFWMLYEVDKINKIKILENMGKFDREKNANVAVSASQTALLWSSSKKFGTIKNVILIEDFIKMNVDEYDVNPQVVQGKNIIVKNYNFTEGIGKISKDLAIKIASEIFNKGYACAFQIRIGGYKGVLAVDPYLPKETICLRPSMKKYETKNPLTKENLWVIRMASFSPGYIGRQVISLLSDLGTQDKVFEEMIDIEIKKLENSLDSFFFEFKGQSLRISKYSLEMLEQLHIFYKNNKSNQLNRQNKDITNNKLSSSNSNTFLRTNPFFVGIYNTIKSYRLKTLREKCKIHDQYSARLIGIIDEWGLLNENEVYVQIKINDQLEEKLGLMTVTKDPCGYWEDVQVLYRVENEFFRKHFYDVIIFPRTSIKPIQYLISGGDLDGDVFFVSWNSNLAP